MACDEPIVILRKTPSQARSAWTVDLILQAAAQVLEARGEDELTTKRVAKRAGVSMARFTSTSQTGMPSSSRWLTAKRNALANACGCWSTATPEIGRIPPVRWSRP